MDVSSTLHNLSGACIGRPGNTCVLSFPFYCFSCIPCPSSSSLRVLSPFLKIDCLLPVSYMITRQEAVVMWHTWCQFRADEGEVGRTTPALTSHKGPHGDVTIPFPFNTPCHSSKIAGKKAGLCPGCSAKQLSEDLGRTMIITLDTVQGEGAVWALQRAHTSIRADKGSEYKHACVPDVSG